MNELVQIQNGKSITTSLKVAEVFGKRHDHVLRAIQNLECSEEFRQRNFGESSYTNSQNKKMPCFIITRDGFSFLVMGFTGELAGKIKEQIIHNSDFDIDLSIISVVDYRKPHQKTYIMEDKRIGIFKIGKAQNPKFRERTLQAQKPVIELVAVCEKLVERQIHKEYALCRVRGEWFKLTTQQLQNIISKYNFTTISGVWNY